MLDVSAPPSAATCLCRNRIRVEDGRRLPSKLCRLEEIEEAVDESLSRATEDSPEAARCASSGSQVVLADWHVLGELAHSLSAKGQAGYGKRTIDFLGELLGRTPSVVLKARKFARLYSASKAAKLEGKLSWSAIGRLMWIDDESVRTALEAECQTKKLSLRALEREIRSRVGRQRDWGHGGRSSRRPESLSEVLIDLDQLLTRVLHWYHGLESATSSEVATHSQNRPSSRTSTVESFGIDQLPPPLRRRIADTMGDLERLREAVQGAVDARVGETPSRPVRRRR